MKVAVVGLGRWGRHLITAMQGSAKLQVVAATSRQPKPETRAFLNAHGIPLAQDLGAILARDDVTGVILATPHSVHEQQALQVLACDKHVFCEKPVAMTAAGAARIVVAAAKQGKVLGVGHERRFEPAIRQAMSLVRKGVLGKLLHVDANLSHDLFRSLPMDNWRLAPQESPAGLMTAVGVHITDILVAVAGPARSDSCLSESHVFAPPARDHAVVDIQFQSGARAVLTMLSATPYYGRITWFGDRGWVELKFGGVTESGLPTELTLCTGSSSARTTTPFPAGKAVLENLEAWADAVEAGLDYPITGHHVRDNAALLEAIVASESADGAWVDVRLG